MADVLIDERPLKSLKVVELREWLHKRGIKTTGKKKADLVLR